jgi:hypothetical protein
MRQREVARRVGISQSSVNENKFHPYHIRITLVQGLKDADYPKKLKFPCENVMLVAPRIWSGSLFLVKHPVYVYLADPAKSPNFYGEQYEFGSGQSQYELTTTWLPVPEEIRNLQFGILRHVCLRIKKTCSFFLSLSHEES